MLSSSSHIGVVIIHVFLTVPCVGLLCVIMAFADHNHLLLSYIFENSRYVISRS